MNHQDISGDAAHLSDDQLELYVTEGNELDHSEVVRLEEHLSGCSACRERVAGIVVRVSPRTGALLTDVWNRVDAAINSDGH